ncbi:MAG: SET domain-containing protein-lysine N-methyltransferase [Aggregatilineales bacterium]
MINHSCDPNAGVKGQNVLVARRDIAPGEEICFDYETTDTQGMNFVCRCGSPKCRKRIRGQAWKNRQFQEANWEYLSEYIQRRLLSSRKTCVDECCQQAARAELSG